MSSYLFVYHGGGMPETESEATKVFTKWQNWMVGMGDAVIDGGNPVGMSSTVHSDGTVSDNGGSNPVSGYGIFSAESLEAALTHAKCCPILDIGGSVEVAEIHEIAM